MTKQNNSYLITLFVQIILIIIFTNIYNNYYKDTKTSFFQENNDRKVYADSLELMLKISNDSTISKSYQDFRDILKVQKSAVDNIYNKLENKNATQFVSMMLQRPEHRATAIVNNLHKGLHYGDTIAMIKDSACQKDYPVIFRQIRQTFSLGYRPKKETIGNLSKALDDTKSAIDFDRKLCNRIIENSDKQMKNTKLDLANRIKNISVLNYRDFLLFSATIQFTFNYTDVKPSSSRLLLLCLIHKIIAGILYFILINQLKKRFF
jgi:preprotein translocase subunit YajC